MSVPEDAIERAGEAAFADRHPDLRWERVAESVRETWRGNAEAALVASGLPARVAELNLLARELCDALADPANFHWGPRGQECECEDCSAKRDLMGRACTVLNAKGAPDA